MSEFAGAARERHCSQTSLEGENDMAERLVVAWTRPVKRYVTVEDGGTGRTGINDLCPDLDLLQTRRRYSTESARKPSELCALLRHMKLSASRKGRRFRKSR